MLKMEIQADIADVHKALEGLGLEIKNINKKILQTLTTRARTKVRASIKQNLNVKGGGKDGVLTRVYKSAKTGAYGVVGVGWAPFMVHELGATINAKDGASGAKYGRANKSGFRTFYGFKKMSTGYLTFQVDGKWLKCKSVKIPARPSFYPAVEAFAGSTEYIDIIERVLAREVKKAWEK
jgi:hypothetical protein